MRRHTIDGVKTVVYTAGHGEPLVFFHGAGTVDGFDFAEPWADKFRVIVPYHPGFGESGDDPTFTDLHDYVMHYLELFDMLELDRFNLVGLSLGGYLAAKFASEHGHRVKKLALIAPAGMIDRASIRCSTSWRCRASRCRGCWSPNFDVLKKRLPEKPDLDFMGDRYREATTVARLLWEHPGDPKFMRYLHRIKMPTLIVWGDEDKIIPVAAGGDLAQVHPQRRHQGVQGRGPSRASGEAGGGGGGRRSSWAEPRSGADRRMPTPRTMHSASKGAVHDIKWEDAMDRRTFVKGSAAAVGAATLPHGACSGAVGARQAPVRLRDHAVRPARAGRGIDERVAVQAVGRSA